jgi:hypothetical protein
MNENYAKQLKTKQKYTALEAPSAAILLSVIVRIFRCDQGKRKIKGSK